MAMPVARAAAGTLALLASALLSVPALLSLGLQPLPAQTGTFSVATCLRRINGIRVRFFFPSDDRKKASISWLPPPVYKYVLGYGIFARLSTMMSILLAGALSRVKMQLSECEDLSDRSDKYPIMFFSHGIGSCCTTYSSFAAEMASHGIIVVCIEHRDGSAACTVDQDTDSVINYQHSTRELLADDNGFSWRNSQQRQRVREVFQVINCLQHDVGSLQLPWQQHRLDFDALIMSGHSFGGATAIAASAAAPALFKCILAIDSWLWPLVGDDMDLAFDFSNEVPPNFQRYCTAAGDAGDRDCPPPPPQLFVESDDFISDRRWVAPKIALSAWHPASMVLHLRGAGHYNGSDIPLLASDSVMALLRALRSKNRATADGLKRGGMPGEGEGEGEGDDGADGADDQGGGGKSIKGGAVVEGEEEPAPSLLFSRSYALCLSFVRAHTTAHAAHTAHTTHAELQSSGESSASARGRGLDHGQGHGHEHVAPIAPSPLSAAVESAVAQDEVRVLAVGGLSSHSSFERQPAQQPASASTQSRL